MKVINIIEEKQYRELSKLNKRVNEKSCIVFPNYSRREKKYGLGTSKDKPSRIDEIKKEVEILKNKYYGR